MLKHIYKGQKRLSASEYNALIDNVKAMDRMSVEAPLELVGDNLRFAFTSLWAILQGYDSATTAYTWQEIGLIPNGSHVLIDGGLSGNPALAPAYELNGLVIPVGTIVRMRPGWDGEFVFESNPNFANHTATKTHTTNALLKGTFTKTHSTDSLIGSPTATVNVTDFVQILGTYALTSGLNIYPAQVIRLSGYTIGAAFPCYAVAVSNKTDLQFGYYYIGISESTNSGQPLYLVLDTSDCCSKPHVSHSTNAWLKALTKSKTHTTSAVFKKLAKTKTHTTDAKLLKALQQTTDAYKVFRKTKYQTTNAYIAVAVTKTHTTNAYKVNRFQRAHTTNSLLRELTELVGLPIWNPVLNYPIGTVVTYLNVIYTSLLPTNMGQNPLTSPTYWNPIGSTSGIPFWNAVTTYPIGTQVTYNNNVYTSIVSNTNQLPTNTTYFSLAYPVPAPVFSHSTNTLLKKTGITKTHTTNSQIGKRGRYQSANSLLKALKIAKTHTTDTDLAKGRYHSTDTLLKGLSILLGLKPYNPALFYPIGSQVSFYGNAYICITATTGNDPTNTSFWTLERAIGGIPLWNSTTAYMVGTQVSYGGIVYNCLIANTGVDTSNTMYWSVAYALSVFSHCTDSCLAYQTALSFTTNALLKKTKVAKTFTTNALLKKTGITKTHTTDADIAVANPIVRTSKGDSYTNDDHANLTLTMVKNDFLIVNLGITNGLSVTGITYNGVAMNLAVQQLNSGYIDMRIYYLRVTSAVTTDVTLTISGIGDIFMSAVSLAHLPNGALDFTCKHSGTTGTVETGDSPSPISVLPSYVQYAIVFDCSDFSGKTWKGNHLATVPIDGAQDATVGSDLMGEAFALPTSTDYMEASIINYAGTSSYFTAVGASFN